MLTILHTGDIHLDSPFQTADDRPAEVRNQVLRDTFSSMISYAEKQGVDLLLIAGDLFDRDRVTRETTAFLCHELARFGRPVVIAPGNHDFYAQGSVWDKIHWPENVYLFTESELSCFSFDGYDVWGYAFTEREMYGSPLMNGTTADTPRDKIRLLCAHGALGDPLSPYAPLSRADLTAFGADYAALGHVHNPGEIERRDGTVFGYCGCPEGRAPNETGAKGAVLIRIEKTAEETTVRTERIRFSRYRYETLEADCTDAGLQHVIEEKLLALIREKGYGEDTILRVILRGRVDPSLCIDTEMLAGRLRPVFRAEVIDETLPALSAKDFLNDRTVRGEFYRMLARQIENGSPEERRIASMALRMGLAAIAGENIR